jgi:hypothetical protein
MPSGSVTSKPLSASEGGQTSLSPFLAKGKVEKGDILTLPEKGEWRVEELEDLPDLPNSG